MRAELRRGNDLPGVRWSEGLKSSVYSKELGLLESGRIRMLSGDFLGSSTNFAKLIDGSIEQSDSGPVVRIGDFGSELLAGTVADDRARPYRVPAYEFIGALQYQMLNHIILGSHEAAAVEARRAVFAQDQIAERYAAEVDQAQAKAMSDSGQAYGAVEARIADLAPVIDLTRSSFESGLAWYLCGVVLEHDGDAANAALAYRKAWELVPDNAYVRHDFLRTLRSQNPELYRSLSGRVGEGGGDRASNEILVVVEEGLISQRGALKIPIPVPGLPVLASADFPIYEDPPYSASNFGVFCDGQALGNSSFALAVQSLAYRDLRERMPGVVLRNVTRAGTRAAAQYAANQINDYTKFGVMLFNAISMAVNEADTRSWCTLPMAAHIFRGGVEAGSHTVELRNSVTGRRMSIPVEVATGESRLIWVADIGGNARVATASLDGSGAPSTFMVRNSLLQAYHGAGDVSGSARTLYSVQMEGQGR